MRTAASLLLPLLLALLACKSGSSKSSSATDASPGASAVSGNEEPIGKLGGATAAELEARATKLGYSLKSKDEDDDLGVEVSTLELEHDEHFAYVTLVDLGKAGGKSHASELGREVGLVVHFDIAPERANAARILEQVIAKKPLDELSRDALREPLGTLGWKQDSSTSDTEDGVVRTSISASKGDDDADLVLFDFRAAKREGRVAAEGNRFVNVFVCQDCTKRREGVLADMKHRRLARKLLATLTNP